MMLGKTNIMFVAKSDASEAQLIQERYLTPSTSEIIKIEYLKNMFFVYTSDKEVMYGADIGSLAFIKKDGKNLKATHFIYHEGTYYFCNAYTGSKLRSYVYATKDFIDYEEIIIEEDEDESFDMFSLGIFKDSQGRIIVVTYKYKHTSSVSYAFTHQSSLHILSNFDERQDEEILRDDEIFFVSANSSGEPHTDAMLIKDRIFSSGIVCDLAGNTQQLKKDIRSYANDYFYTSSYTSDYNLTGIYKSFDGINWALCLSVDIEDAQSWPTIIVGTKKLNNGGKEVLPLAGKTCLIYSCQGKIYANLADKTNLIGSSSNETFELDISDLSHISAMAEDEAGNTYIGFSGGGIIKLYLDQDGSTQLPDVQLVKTLAAKQALAQAKQYTDEKAAELKAYVDSKIEQNAEDNIGQQ